MKPASPVAARRPFDVYKIADHLERDEETLGVERVEPVSGERMRAGAYFESAVRGWRPDQGPLLTPRELGATRAHRQVYRRIMDAGRPALVLEADARASAARLRAVEDLIERHPGAVFLHLAEDARFRMRGRRLATGSYRVNPHFSFFIACAYFVTPPVAAELEAFHASGARRCDDWLAFFRGSQTTPLFAPVFRHPFEESSVEGERRSRGPALSGGRGLLWRRRIERLWSLRTGLLASIPHQLASDDRAR